MSKTNANKPLTVAGLIDVLKGFDENLTVKIGDLYDNGYFATVTPDMVNTSKDGKKDFVLIFLE